MGSKDTSWEELSCESLCSGTLSSTRFSLNSCSHSGMSELNGARPRFTWANISERRILVSNVCVTCNSFCEFYTSDRFTIGCYDCRRTTRFRQGIHFRITQVLFFLLIMCIDAPESTTTTSRSSGLRVDAGRHLLSEGEKNVALSCSFNFNTFLASFHAASRAPCSCHAVSSRDRSSNFRALGLRSWGSPGQENPSEGFWSRMYAWRATAFVNFTRRIGAACLSSSLRSMKTSAAPYPEIRNPIVVYLMSWTQQVRGARDSCHGKQQVSPF